MASLYKMAIIYLSLASGTSFSAWRAPRGCLLVVLCHMGLTHLIKMTTCSMPPACPCMLLPSGMADTSAMLYHDTKLRPGRGAMLTSTGGGTDGRNGRRMACRRAIKDKARPLPAIMLPGGLHKHGKSRNMDRVLHWHFPCEGCLPPLGHVHTLLAVHFCIQAGHAAFVASSCS